MSRIMSRISHPEEEVLEAFALGRLQTSEVDEIEEHLLLCSDCQRRLTDLDLFLTATRRAAAELMAEQPFVVPIRKSTRPWYALPAWGYAAAAAAIVAVAVPLASRQPAAPQAVELSAFRGDATGAAIAEPGRPLAMSFDAQGIAAEDCCVVEIVDAAGSTIESEAIAPTDDKIKFSAKAKSEGTYWVRLRSRDGVLMREAGLQVRR